MIIITYCSLLPSRDRHTGVGRYPEWSFK